MTRDDLKQWYRAARLTKRGMRAPDLHLFGRTWEVDRSETGRTWFARIVDPATMRSSCGAMACSPASLVAVIERAYGVPA